MLGRTAAMTLFALIAVLAISGLVIANASREGPPRSKLTEQIEGHTDQPNAISWRGLWTRTLNEPVAFFTGVLSLFSGLLVLVTLLQIFLLVRAEGIAKTTAEAAKATAQTAEDNLVKLQRAFVGVDGITYLSHDDPKTGKVWWSFHVRWRNSGASPTKGLRFLVSKYLEDVDIPDNYKFEVDDANRPINHLAPGAVTASGELRASGDELLAVQKGEKFLYLWGRADYRDVFDGTPDHVTKFYVRVELRGDPTKPWDPDDILEVLFVHQPKHNCADEECLEEN